MNVRPSFDDVGPSGRFLRQLGAGEGGLGRPVRLGRSCYARFGLLSPSIGNSSRKCRLVGVSTLPRPAMSLCPILHVPRRRAIHMCGYGREDVSLLLNCPHDYTCLMWTGGGKKAAPKSI